MCFLVDMLDTVSELTKLDLLRIDTLAISLVY